MPANSTHPDYDESLSGWLRARDVIAGEDAVKAAGEKYLPRLTSQNDAEYLAYKTRAAFFNATARTADGYIGLIFRREPTFKLPEKSSGVGKALNTLTEDADMLGTSLQSYAKHVVSEVITIGRCGTLVDWEDVAEQRAFAVLYKAEQIINWRMDRVNGRNVLVLLVLKEQVPSLKSKVQPDGKQDDFELAMVEQLRVLRLVPSAKSADGTQSWEYLVEVWQEQKVRRNKTEWVKVESRKPLRLGKPLPAIPFVFHGPRHFLPDVDKLPLADIINANLDHYRLNADYKHGLHYTALPTAWVSGFPKDSKLHVGSSVAWVADQVGATAGFLEFQGQGLTTFERAMDRVEQHMALLGSRMLEASKRVGETADAIELRQSGENSVLSAVSFSISDSLTHVLRWVYWWNSTEESPDAIGDDVVLVTLNTDFKTKGMTSDQITAIVAAWQAGALSRDSMFELFRKGEVLPAGRSNEEEATLLKANPVPQPTKVQPPQSQPQHQPMSA